MPEFLNPAEAEFWVGVGLLIFLGIVIFVAKAPAAIAQALDAQSAAIRADLDEAERISEEAKRLLATLKAERVQAEQQAQDMLAAAQAQARQFEIDARAKLEEQIRRRTEIAERKIATAEAQAQAEVKSAAAELAAQLAEGVLSQRLASGANAPLIDRAIAQLAAKLQ